MQRDWNGFHTAAVSLATAAVKWSVAIQGFCPIAAHGRPDAIVVPRHWSEIADEESHVGRILSVSQERDDTPFKIAAIHPLESGGFEIDLVQGGLRPEESVQIAHPPQQPGMQRTLQQAPLQAAIVVPFVPLAKVVTHEQQLLPGMAPHIAVKEPQVREL